MSAEIRCPIATCPRHAAPADAFLSLGALGSHKRRVHGIRSVVLPTKRPPGGDLRCPYPECETLNPYVTKSGRESHLRKVHGAGPSENPDSVRRRNERAIQRAAAQLVRDIAIGVHDQDKRFEIPPPPHPNVASHPGTVTALSPGGYEYLRRRVLLLVNGVWARELDVAPIAIRNGIERICLTNFSIPKRKLPPPVKKRRA